MRPKTYKRTTDLEAVKAEKKFFLSANEMTILISKDQSAAFVSPIQNKGVNPNGKVVPLSADIPLLAI